MKLLLSKKLLILVLFLGLTLRLYRLGSIPPSLYWDEASIGYNAYSIATTLHDEHGILLPVSNFAAFGDYKAPGYIYVDSLVIKILGLSEFSVRLPSAFAGTFLILLTYLLARELISLFRPPKFTNLTNITPLLSALFVAISPWSLQMSRGAFEANLATLFSAIGVLFFLKAIHHKRTIFFILTSIFMAGAMYTFNSHRVTVPLLLGTLALIFSRTLMANWKKVLVGGIFFVVLLAPSIPFFLSADGRLRFQEVTWLNDLSIVEKSNELINANKNSWWANIIYNRRVFYTQEFIKHYTDHFRPSFLFGSGDINPRLSNQTVGEFYWIDSIFLILGLLFLLRYRSKTSAILFSAILIGIIPAALARETPHALRILPVLPFPQIMAAIGLGWVISILKNREVLYKSFALTILFGYIFLLISYFYSYYFDYPVKYADDWQYGYKQAVRYVSQVQNNYDHISVTGKLGRAYIYFLFYNQYSPEKYWQNGLTYKDSFGFWNVDKFDKYVFNGDTRPTGKWLFMQASEDTPVTAKVLKSIYNPMGRIVFNFYESR